MLFFFTSSANMFLFGKNKGNKLMVTHLFIYTVGDGSVKSSCYPLLLIYYKF